MIRVTEWTQSEGSPDWDYRYVVGNAFEKYESGMLSFEGLKTEWRLHTELSKKEVIHGS